MLVALFAIRARVIGRASAASYGQGIRRGALAEFVTWSVGFAVFFPLTLAADEFLFSTVPSPSSPFFGVLISGMAIVALIVLTGFHRMLERFGYRLWPPVSVGAEASAGLRLPTLRDSRLLTLGALALFVVALAASIALFG